MVRLSKKIKTVGLDSNIFSYQFHQDPIFGSSAKQIFDLLSLNKLQAVTSVVTFIEILSVKASIKEIKELEKLFLRTPNLGIFEVNQTIASEAAKIRREYGFRIPDAIQLATALTQKAQAFVTNDKKLKGFKGLKIILLSSDVRYLLAVYKDSL